MSMFGNTPAGIILLDFILIAMGMILSPLLWGIFKRLGDISQNMTEAVKTHADTNNKLASVITELHNAQVRDVSLEGRIKGINDKLDRHIREEKNR